MRWTLIFLLCLAVASAKYGNKKTRFGRMLQNIANLDDDIERGMDDWSDEDSDESDEDDVWQQPQRRHYNPRHKKQQQQKPCPHCVEPRGRTKWMPIDQDQDDDDIDTQEDQYIQPTHKKQQRRHQREDEDEYESSEDEYESPEDEYSQRTHKDQRRHQRDEDEPRHQRDEDQPKQCKPNFNLLQKLDRVNAQLAAKLHRDAKQISDDKNIVVSPVAVQLALAAVAQGARGSTKRQITQLLNAGIPKSQGQNAYAALTKALKGQGSDQSESKTAQIKSTTNLVLGQQSAQDQFIESIKTCFDGEVKKCDFRQNTQKCRDQINQWVTNKSGFKSQNPLTQNAVSGNTKMLSIGTMQLKGTWGKQFRKNIKTTQGQFYPLGEQKPTQVKTLETEGDFNYFEDEQMQVLGVQTQEKQLTMYVILPKQRHGLNKLEKQRIQYGQQLQEIMDRCDSRKQSLKVQLPAFQITYNMDAKQTLRKMGIEDAFDGDQADFSGISDEPEEHLLKHGRRQTGGLEDIDVKKAGQQYKQQHQLHLNKLIQQATIQVDENGLDAASGKSQSSKSKQSKSESDEEKEDWEKEDHHQFHANHAFAFVVKHNPTNQLLLIGRVIDAAQKAEVGKGETESELSD